MKTRSAIAREWNLGQPVLSLISNARGDFIAASLGDGSVAILPAGDDAQQPKFLHLHDGISLCLAKDADEHSFLSSGDDGKIFIIDPEIENPTLLVEHSGKWIDHAAGSAEGFRAYSIGKQVYILDAEGNPHGEPRKIPSSAGGLAFSPNGKRLAAAHYNGISLWWMNSKESAPEILEWKGSHLLPLWHPDGKIILSSLQDGALHGWDLAREKEMQMQGYAAKIRSMGFTAKGKFLATSGADQVICWPFFGGGPWGKKPTVLGGSDARLVTCVAPHPSEEVVAAGYDDGMMILAPMDGRMELLLHIPVAFQGVGVTGMAWNSEGNCLFAGTENGKIFLFTQKSVSDSVKI